MQSPTSAKYDITLYGATSFVGKIAVDYLLKNYGAGNDRLRWCIAARSQDKLNALVEELGVAAAKVPQQIADSMNEEDMQQLCDSSSVIISTIGPYAFYGETLIKSCAESGTHYCDLTGEPLWMADMIEKYQGNAKQSGAMIVHCCGFDSIPSDLGVYYLQKKATETFGEICQDVETGLKAASGAFSGGTVASLINAVKLAAENPDLRKRLANPYLLCPNDHPFKSRQRTESFYLSEQLDNWCAPFVMAAINTKVVHRSNALMMEPYGKNFRYSEYTMTGKSMSGRIKAIGLTAGMGGFMAMLAAKPSRAFLEKFALPKPGEGPSPEAQEKGFFDLRIAGTSPNGKLLTVKVTGDKDPGYGSTAKMLSESALCLLDLTQQEKARGGFWTPASLMNDALIERLEMKAGLTFSQI